MGALQNASVFAVPNVDPSVYITNGTTPVGDVTCSVCLRLCGTCRALQNSSTGHLDLLGN
jgi:hypothetical protein